MLSLKLHSSHQQKPKQTFLSIIAAGDELMINEGHIWLLNVSFLPLVVAYQNDGRVKTSNEFSNDPIKKVLRPKSKTDVVEKNACNVDLHRDNCT